MRPPKPPQPLAAGAPFGPQTPPAPRAPGAHTQGKQGARGSPGSQEDPGQFVERGCWRMGAPPRGDPFAQVPGCFGPSRAKPRSGQRLDRARSAASPDGYKRHLRQGQGEALARPASTLERRVGPLTRPIRANKRRAQGRLKPPRAAAQRSALAVASAARQAMQLLRRTA